MFKIGYRLKLMVIKFTSLIMQWLCCCILYYIFQLFDWIYFIFFLGSSSTIDGIEDKFQNILGDYDDEEESGVTMMEESGDSFWRIRKFLFCYVLGVWIILLCHTMRLLLWYCLVKHLDNII